MDKKDSLHMGKRFEIVFNHLLLGGKIETTGMNIGIDETTMEPAFLVRRWSISDGEPRLVETLCAKSGSDLVYSLLIEYARGMSKENIQLMSRENERVLRERELNEH